MKLRITGFVLAVLILVSLITPAFAAKSDVSAGDPVTEWIPYDLLSGDSKSVFSFSLGLPDWLSTLVSVVNPSVGTPKNEINEDKPEVNRPVSDSPCYLDGVQMADLEWKIIKDEVYVTVSSFMSSMDPETVVEYDGASVSAELVKSTVADVFPLPRRKADLAVAKEESLRVTAQTGDCYLVANGRYLYVKNCIQSIDGSAAAPVSVLARAFNLNVTQDKTGGNVLLTHVEGADRFIECGDTYYDADTLYWLSHIIYAEVGNQSMRGQIAVGNVVMNRVRSYLFPNTIEGVLFQKNQFSVVPSGAIYKDPSTTSIIAAKLVMDGAVVLKNALFFNLTGMNTYASRNRTYVTTIGVVDFFA